MNVDELVNRDVNALYLIDGIYEINEAILILYKIIYIALEQEADQLVLTKSEIFWEHIENKLGEYPISAQPDRGYDGELDFMLSRDATLREYVEKLPASPTMSSRYKLTQQKNISQKKDK